MEITLATINTDKGTAVIRYDTDGKSLTSYFVDGSTEALDASERDLSTWRNARRTIIAWYGNDHAYHDSWVLCLRPIKAIMVSTSEGEGK